MVIDLTSQRAAVYRNGMLIGITTIASGKPGYETPNGVFTVLEKQRMHHSNKYDDAPMPFMQRLSWSGLALHGGHPRGYPASHGCIRLPMGFAAALFKEETRGMQVVITGHAPGKQNTLMASRQTTHAPAQSDNLQAAKYWSGQGESNAPQESPCCAPAAGAATGHADNEANSGADNPDVYQNPDQPRDNERNNGHYQGQDDRDRSQDIPPPDLPPPPGL